MSGLICAGNVYLDLYSSGSLTGIVGPINATKFSISPGKAETIDRTSYMRDTFGQALDSVVFPGVASLSIETDDAAAEILQYALLGTLTDAPVWQEKARSIWPKFYDQVGGKAMLDEALAISAGK